MHAIASGRRVGRNHVATSARNSGKKTIPATSESLPVIQPGNAAFRT